jgi:MtN3 and saliva related transmembrane protein
MRHNVRMMLFNFLIPLIGILATIFAVSSTVPQIIKGIKTRKMDDVSVWLIMTLIIGLSLWVVYGISKSDVVIAGGNSVGVSLNVILLLLKIKYSRNPVS